MKKLISFATAAMLACFSANAQIDKNALGLRIGGGNHSGVELSYQLGMDNNINRLELDLGFSGSSSHNIVGLAGIYQWVWPIGSQGFNWYAGPGAGLSIASGKGNSKDYFGISIGGQIGIGYNFRSPLQLTLDTRPIWDFLSNNDAFGWGIALGIRYRF